MKAVRVHAFGGPEVLTYEDAPDPIPQAGQALVRVEATGVNFIDTYHRTGVYKNSLPIVLGVEGAGMVTALGPGATAVSVGDRVAWAEPACMGSYGELIAVPANRLVTLPPSVTTRQGAAAILQGITAHYLACSTYALKPGDTCLVHAGAGGVGLLLIQIAKMRGATVITTVSTDEKAALARTAGADHVILYTREDFEVETKKITGGRGVQVVYDSVGKTTFDKSLNSLVPRGLLALFGQSSGVVPPVDPQVLSQKGALFLTRPTIAPYVATTEELRRRAGDVFNWMTGGALKVRMEFEFPLRDAADAHRALEGRKTTGKVILIP
jgi:NADPH2:quinone reductase